MPKPAPRYSARQTRPHSSASAPGKGDARRSAEDRKKFEEGYDAIFGQGFQGLKKLMAAPAPAPDPALSFDLIDEMVECAFDGPPTNAQRERARRSGNPRSSLGHFERWWGNPVNQPPFDMIKRYGAKGIRAQFYIWMRRAFSAGMNL